MTLRHSGSAGCAGLLPLPLSRCGRRRPGQRRPRPPPRRFPRRRRPDPLRHRAPRLRRTPARLPARRPSSSASGPSATPTPRRRQNEVPRGASTASSSWPKSVSAAARDARLRGAAAARRAAPHLPHHLRAAGAPSTSGTTRTAPRCAASSTSSSSARVAASGPWTAADGLSALLAFATVSTDRDAQLREIARPLLARRATCSARSASRSTGRRWGPRRRNPAGPTTSGRSCSSTAAPRRPPARRRCRPRSSCAIPARRGGRTVVQAIVGIDPAHLQAAGGEARRFVLDGEVLRRGEHVRELPGIASSHRRGPAATTRRSRSSPSATCGPVPTGWW